MQIYTIGHEEFKNDLRKPPTALKWAFRLICVAHNMSPKLKSAKARQNPPK